MAVFSGGFGRSLGFYIGIFNTPQDAIVEVTRDPQKAMTGPAEGQPKTYPWEVVGVRAPFKAWELAEGEETRQMHNLGSLKMQEGCMNSILDE